ncbi:MAG: pantoate--beta-alanine ligase [Spirochaetota bacterium]
MAVLDTIDAMRRYVKGMRGKRRIIGFVPTMGALHEGHASLVRAARKECDIVIVSIFVNPAQFAPNEDISKYPRTFEHDRALLETIGAHAVFYPSARMMYPSGFATAVSVDSLSSMLCGMSRPTHFRGVATVVAKLFIIVAPDKAYFGEKDFQQAAIISRMTEDLNIPVTVRACPIVREPDGLAMSSRNVYLSPTERKDAVLLYRSLITARKTYREGVRDPARLKDSMKTVLAEGKSLKLDYIEFVDPVTLAPHTRADNRTRMIMAVYCGKTRLIDNMRLA